MTTGFARRRSIALVILLGAASALGNHDVRASTGYTQIFSKWVLSLGNIDQKTVLFVNGNGAAAGNQTSPSTGIMRGFIWTLSDGFVDPGTLGGPNATLVGFNDNRVAAGNSAIAPGGPTRAFAWTKNDGISDLGTLGGSFAEAAAINDHDWIVGRSATFNDRSELPFVWTPSRDIATLPDRGCWRQIEGTTGGATAVSNTGLVAGYGNSGISDVDTGGFVYHAMLWNTTSETCTDLFGSPDSQYHGDYSKAERVTDSGWVAGTIIGFPHSTGFVWSATAGVRTAGERVTDLNEDGWATAIDGSGHGIVLIPGQADIDLGLLAPDTPFFVLDNHIVVGSSVDETEVIGFPHGFYWDQATGRHELDTDPLDHTTPLNHSGNRFVGVNHVVDDDDLFSPIERRLFVWDGTVHTLMSRTAFFPEISIQVGNTGFVAGTIADDFSIEGAKMWAPPLSYNFSGFLPPAQNGVMNDAKAGQRIQIRFAVGDDHVPDVLKWGYPRIQDVDCTTGMGPVEDTTDGPGNNVNNLPQAPPVTLQPGADRYTFTWDTERSFANSCKSVQFALIDNSGGTLLFQFR
jgi:probable HAF family extracellular repeat protein